MESPSDEPLEPQFLSTLKMLCFIFASELHEISFTISFMTQHENHYLGKL
jgi:hypothetical protein